MTKIWIRNICFKYLKYLFQEISQIFFSLKKVRQPLIPDSMPVGCSSVFPAGEISTFADFCLCIQSAMAGIEMRMEYFVFEESETYQNFRVETERVFHHNGLFPDEPLDAQLRRAAEHHTMHRHRQKDHLLLWSLHVENQGDVEKHFLLTKSDLR